MSNRILASALISGAACARETVLENLPPKWTPTSSLTEMGPVDLGPTALATKVPIDACVDTRRNPSSIAQNTEKPERPRPIERDADHDSSG